MYFIYNNKNSKDFNIKIKSINNLSSPQRSIEKISVLASKNRGKILFGAGDNPYILLREKTLKGDKLIESVNNVLKCLQNDGD